MKLKVFLFSLIIGVLLISAAFCLSAEPFSKGVVRLKVERKQCSFPAGNVVRLGGFVGERFRANKDGYLHTFDIDGQVRMVEEKKWRDWWWIGEQPGKWLESAVLNSEQSGDRELRRKGKEVLGRLSAAQEPSGYIGITDAAVRTDKQPLRGMDPYELYFMEHGLLTAYEVWADRKGLETARRLGDYFVEKIGEGKAEFWPSDLRAPENYHKVLGGQSSIAGHSVHYGWEGTLLVDPILRLYELTGNKKYLEWCKWVVGNIDKWSGWDAYSRLDDVAAGKIGIDELQPYVHAHTFHMNFLGFLRMYQITGDENYFRKVSGAWDDIARRQMYITGGVSVGEHYEAGHNLPITGSVVETCATMSWIELTQYLLELTGDTKYADAIEKLLWNHLFAAQTIDGDCNRYHTPLNGVKPAGYFHGPDCCTGSGHRIISKVPSLIYAQDEDSDIYVNQYVDSEARFEIKGGRVTIIQKTDYPGGEKIEIEVKPEKKSRFGLNLRLPAWCEKPLLKVNGEEKKSFEPGIYARIEREWEKGDKVELVLGMGISWIKGEHTTEGMWALRRGPVIYALDTVYWDKDLINKVGGAPSDLSGGVGIVIDEANPEAGIEVTEAPAKALGPAVDVEAVFVDGQRAKVKMLPFANIGRWYREASDKPDRNNASFSYAIWLHNSESEEFKKKAEQYRSLQRIGWQVKSGSWSLVDDGTIFAQMSLEGDCQAFAKEAEWRDYVYEVRARKKGGAEGFLIIFRVKDKDNFYWWNIGGWQNSANAIEREVNGGRTILDRKDGKVESGRWYDIKVVVKGSSIKCYLDGKLIHNIEDSTHKAGGVGLGSWMSEAEYTNLRVRSLDGKIIYEGAFKSLAGKQKSE